jgi:peptide/nickel transport system substrate-binding protein
MKFVVNLTKPLIAMGCLTLALGVMLSPGAAQDTAKTGGTFIVVRDNQWGANNINPFLPGDQHLLPTLSAIYETLFFVNSISGAVTEVLGTDYKWSKDALSLSLNTRKNVKWNDGQAFTAKDVEFTFNYVKKYPALDTSGIWSNGLASVKATGTDTVNFTFSKANTPIFTYLAHLPIIPEHVWSSIADPLTFTNQKPVATGPFVLDTYSVQALKVTKNPNYWMANKPSIDSIVWTVAGGNDGALLRLLKGEVDFGYVGVTNVKGDYADKNPATNLYWWPVNNANFLYMNTAKAPFNDVNFRRAIAMSVDTKDVAQKGYNGNVAAASPSGVIPAQRGKWLNASATKTAYTFNLEKAKAALLKAGYKTDSSGALLGKDGKPFPALKILVGAGWTDFIAMAQVVSENLKKIGVSVSIDQQQWSGYAGALQTGTYDMGISWGWGNGDTPYDLFYKSFSPELSAAVGKQADSNLTRYTNATVTKALQTFRATSDAAVRKTAINQMVAQVMSDVPFVPLTDRSQFCLFNATRFTGFPSEKDPYNDGSPDDAIGARLMYLNVRLK